MCSKKEGCKSAPCRVVSFVRLFVRLFVRSFVRPTTQNNTHISIIYYIILYISHSQQSAGLRSCGAAAAATALFMCAVFAALLLLLFPPHPTCASALLLISPPAFASRLFPDTLHTHTSPSIGQRSALQRAGTQPSGEEKCHADTSCVRHVVHSLRVLPSHRLII